MQKPFLDLYRNTQNYHLFSYVNTTSNEFENISAFRTLNKMCL